jgi:transcription elongation GreA/GreB family factor
MSLEDVSRSISDSLASWKSELEGKKKEILSDIEQTTEDMKVASAMGDRSENAAFVNAVEKLSQLNAQLLNVNSQLKDLLQVTTAENYEPIGMIVLYSTVRLSVNGEEITLKLYPGKLSSIERKILAQESIVGRAMWQKSVGDEFTVEHRVTRESIRYKILEIY